LAKRQANAAVALLKMNYPEKVWPLLKYTPDSRVKESCDPRVRSYIIHRCAPMGADAGVIITHLAMEKDVTIQRALVLSLGEYNAQGLPGDWNSLVRQIQDIYRTAPDPGLHGATEWLLCSWNQYPWLKQTNEGWAKDKEKREQTLDDVSTQSRRPAAAPEGTPAAPPRWYVTDQAQTMVVIPGPVEFLLGSPTTEARRPDGPTGKVETQHTKRIMRSFAIAAKEVTMGQFRRFHKDYFQTDYEDGKEASPSDDCPVNTVSWYQAASYCNWLSKKEGIPENQWCYEKNASGKFDEGMQLVPRRAGYRLPTEAEWEYACRAGALTSYSYGESDELLGKYAWYSENARDRGMLPGEPGHFGKSGLTLTLKPNDFGLFNMMGNASEWCQSKFEDYKAGEDIEDRERIENKYARMIRGGAYTYLAGSVRSAYRIWALPSYRYPSIGFRPAKTLAIE